MYVHKYIIISVTYQAMVLEHNNNAYAMHDF